MYRTFMQHILHHRWALAQSTRTYIHTYMHTCIQTYIHIHTYIHTYRVHLVWGECTFETKSRHRDQDHDLEWKVNEWRHGWKLEFHKHKNFENLRGINAWLISVTEDSAWWRECCNFISSYSSLHSGMFSTVTLTVTVFVIVTVTMTVTVTVILTLHFRGLAKASLDCERVKVRLKHGSCPHQNVSHIVTVTVTGHGHGMCILYSIVYFIFYCISYSSLYFIF